MQEKAGPREPLLGTLEADTALTVLKPNAVALHLELSLHSSFPDSATTLIVTGGQPPDSRRLARRLVRRRIWNRHYQILTRVMLMLPLGMAIFIWFPMNMIMADFLSILIIYATGLR